MIRSRRSVGQFGTRCGDHAFTPDDLADPLRRPISAALFNLHGFASTHRPLSRRIKEVAMFEMVNAERAEPQDRKLLLMKIGAFVVALAVLGGVVYLFTFFSYSAH